MIINLAAPHTWAASIAPVLLATSLSIANHFQVSMLLAMCLLAISILLQSSVNTLNDYFDYIKGTDSESDNLEESDSVLVFNNVNPRSALIVALSFIVIALALGIYCIYCAGFLCLIIALIGILITFLYSGGKLPISYLPIGELVSGFVMGGLITYASYNVLTLQTSPIVLVFSIPLIINIGLIMLTNNASDIEKDKLSKRKTLSTLIGREKSTILYKVFILASYISIFAICLVWYPRSLILYPFVILLTLPISIRLMTSNLSPESRIASMGQICNFNIAIGALYPLMILASTANIAL